MEDHAGIQGVVCLPRALYRKKKYSIFQSILAEHSSIFHGLSNGTCPGNKLPRVTEIWIIIIIIRCMKIFFSLLLPEGQNISGLSRPKSRREKHNSKKSFARCTKRVIIPMGPTGEIIKVAWGKIFSGFSHSYSSVMLPTHASLSFWICPPLLNIYLHPA